MFDYMPTNGKINSFIVEDIDKLYNAYINGIEPIDAFVPTYKNEKEAQSSLNIGDVYEIEGEKNIFILNKNNQPTQLGIDKKTYFELFPPIERYATTQNDIGNCWEITAFNTLLTDPKERESLLRLFKQDGDDIVVSFPSQNIKEVRFKDGELPFSTNYNYTSKGAKGFQLLEFAHAVEEHEKRIKDLIKQIENSILLTNVKNNTPDEQKQIKKVQLEEQLQMLNSLLSTNRDNVVISFDPQKLIWSFELWDKDKHGFDNAVTLTRNGGDPNIIFSKLSYPTTNIKDDFATVYKLISNPKNFEEYIITFGTKEDDYFFPKDSPLVKDHSYRIYPSQINEKTGLVSEFKLIDPAGIIEIPMTISNLRKYDAIYSVARRDKTDNSRISFRGNFYK